MKPRTTLLLLAVGIIVGAIVVWDLRKGTTTDEAAAQRQRLVNLKADDVTRLAISRSNETIVVEKTGDRWQLQQPLTYRGSAPTITSILGDIETAETDRVLTAAELKAGHLAAFGLDQPRYRATLNTPKGPVTLLVGSETATKEAVYVQVAGQTTVAIVRKFLADRLATSVADFRDHDVFEIPAATVTRLEVKAAGRLLELTKTGPRWAITKPSPLRADQQKVDTLVRDLTRLRIQDFVTDDPKEVHTVQLDEPAREITVYVGDKSQTLLLGPTPTNATGKVFAKLKGTDAIFTIAAATAQQFAVQPNDLRDAQILAFNAADVQAIEIGPLVVERQTNGTWQVTGPTPMAADTDRVQETLAKLGSLIATQFVADVAADLNQYGLATPAATVTLRGATTNVLLVGSQDTGKGWWHVKRPDEPFIYGVAAADMAWLPVNALAFRDRQVATLPGKDITRLTIVRKEGRAVLAKDKDGKWTLVEPAQGGLDHDALNQLLEAVAQIRAEDFVEEKVEQPEVQLTFEVAGKEFTLAIGRALPNGYRVVSLSDRALVFTMPDYSLTALLRPVVLVAKPKDGKE